MKSPHGSGKAARDRQAPFFTSDTSKGTQAMTESCSIVEYNQVEAGLQKMREAYGATVWVVDAPSRLKSATKARAEIRGVRVNLEKIRKKIKAPALQRCKDIDAEAARIKAELLALEEPVDYAIREFEAKKEAERKAKKEAEARRIAEAHAAINDIRSLVFRAAEYSTKEIDALGRELSSRDVSRDDEFHEAAQAAKQEAIVALRQLHKTATAREAEMARLEEERRAIEALREEQRKAEEAAKLRAAEEEAKRFKAEQEAAAKEAQIREMAKKLEDLQNSAKPEQQETTTDAQVQRSTCDEEDERKTVTIGALVYQGLVHDSRILEALYAGGVRKWLGYEAALAGLEMDEDQ